jgi:hypothetical protein
MSLSSSEVSANPMTLTFTSANWDIPQTVTVSTVNDLIAEDIETVTITHTVASTDLNYNNLAIQPVTVTVNPDVAGVIVSKASASVAVSINDNDINDNDGRIYLPQIIGAGSTGRHLASSLAFAGVAIGER